ncbi:hypothetical protein [Plantactinospora sp. GCM10030261]|uniref:hypothetical protein n=1 Tax=Plantactinospora sp. GCM10030261 TaxID=3273420 RepID=UPI003619343D
MAQIKRTVIVAGAMAMAALTACAPTGYTGNQAADTEPVAAAAAEPSASPSPSADAEASQKAPQNVVLTGKLVGKKVARMGKVVTDEKGWILYRFDKDSANPPTSNCVDDCARVWPPALTDGTPQLQGVVDDKVGSVDRPDGTRQLTIGGWPVYRYIGDKKPGQWRGQGVGGTWFVVAPDGTKNLTCLPTSPPKPVAPPPADDSDAGSSGGSSY